MLPYTNAELASLTSEIDAWKKRLDYRGLLPRAWVGRLRRDLEAEAIAASTSMEGVPVTVDEVRRILAGDRPAEVRPEDAALVDGYRDAMSFVLRRADDPAFRWDPELVVALHDKILAGNWAAGAARFREGPAYVVNNQTGELVFEPPPPEQVPALVDEACKTMEISSDHPSIQSAWMHVAIASVHPFRDGNGRSARVLASLAMYRGGFKLPEFTSLEEWWGRHLSDYYAAFECLGGRFDPTADVTPFLEAHIRAQLHQVRALDLRERVQRQVWIALEIVAVDAGLEPRVTNALWDVFFGRDVTPRYYRPLADVSAATATNDLAQVVAAGLLRPEGKARARRYLSGPRLNESVASVLAVSGVQGSNEEGARARIIAELTSRASQESPPVMLAT
jgi:Fic family protein